MHSYFSRVLLALLPLAPVALAQPVGDFYIIEKGHDYTQISANTTVEGGFPHPWFFSADIVGDNVSATHPTPPNTITPPGGSPLALSFESGDDNHWQYGEFSFLTQGALDSAYPNGSYGFSAGGNSTSINFTGDLYPDIPLATLSTGFWSGNIALVPAGQNLTISFNLFGPNFAAGLAHMGTFVEKTSGPGSFEGQGEELFPTNPATILALTILAEDLFPGAVYQVETSFDRLINPVNFNGGTGNAFGAYGTITNFQFQVVPEPAVWAGFAGVLALALAFTRRRGGGLTTR